MVELENSSVWISIAVTIRSFDGLDLPIQTKQVGSTLSRDVQSKSLHLLKWITVPSPLPSQADVRALSALLRAADI